MLNKKIEEINNNILAIRIVINSLVEQHEILKEDTNIDDNVKIIIKEMQNSYMKSLTKQMRKEYSNLQTNSIVTKRYIRIFENKFCDNEAVPLGTKKRDGK